MKGIKQVVWKPNGLAGIVIAALCGGWKWALLVFVSSAVCEYAPAAPAADVTEKP